MESVGECLILAIKYPVIFYCLQSLFCVRDILVRIRIRGSLPCLWPMDPDPAILVLDFQDANKKLVFCLFLIEGTSTSFF